MFGEFIWAHSPSRQIAWMNFLFSFFFFYFCFHSFSFTAFSHERTVIEYIFESAADTHRIAFRSYCSAVLPVTATWTSIGLFSFDCFENFIIASIALANPDYAIYPHKESWMKIYEKIWSKKRNHSHPGMHPADCDDVHIHRSWMNS